MEQITVVVSGGVVWPIFDGLPTKPGKYSELCKRAGRNVTVPVEMILPDGLDDIIGGTVGKLTGELTETFSSFFCGDDGSGKGSERPAPKTHKRDVGYPPGTNTDGNGGFQTIRVIARNNVVDKWSFEESINGDPCRHKDNPNDNTYDFRSCDGYERAWGYDPPDWDPERVPTGDDYTPRPVCVRIKDEEITDSDDIFYYMQKR